MLLGTARLNASVPDPCEGQPEMTEQSALCPRFLRDVIASAVVAMWVWPFTINRQTTDGSLVLRERWQPGRYLTALAVCLHHLSHALVLQVTYQVFQVIVALGVNRPPTCPLDKKLTAGVALHGGSDNFIV